MGGRRGRRGEREFLEKKIFDLKSKCLGNAFYMQNFQSPKCLVSKIIFLSQKREQGPHKT